MECPVPTVMAHLTFPVSCCVLPQNAQTAMPDMPHKSRSKVVAVIKITGSEDVAMLAFSRNTPTEMHSFLL